MIAVRKKNALKAKRRSLANLRFDEDMTGDKMTIMGVLDYILCDATAHGMDIPEVITIFEGYARQVRGTNGRLAQPVLSPYAFRIAIQEITCGRIALDCEAVHEMLQVYDVDRGLQCAFKQSIVAITLSADAAAAARADGADDGARAAATVPDDDTPEGELSVIGDITQRIVVVPADYSAG